MLKRALGGLVFLIALTSGGAWLLHASIDLDEDARAMPPVDRTLIAGVRSWGYQLQQLDIGRLAAAKHDLVVVDETLDGQRRASSVERTLNRLKFKGDGQRRLVLSYLSIGEAEDYRSYWRPSWVSPIEARISAPGLKDLAGLGATPARANPRFIAPANFRPLQGPSSVAPAWLGDENAEWRSNYLVRFWHPDWQNIMFGHKDAALDRIIAAGFDGVYLDRADVYDLWRSEHPTAKAEMGQFIERLAAYARHQRPGFLVVLQNAEELLTSRSLRSALDAVAKEDLLFGVEGEGQPNKAADVEASIKYLNLARKDGLPVLAVEYVADGAVVATARQRLEAEGFIPHFAPRGLNALGAPG